MVLFVLLLLVSNKRSFRLTKNAFEQVKSIEDKLEFVNQSNQGIDELRAGILSLDRAIGKQGVAPEIVQHNILDFCAKFPKIRLITMDEIHYASSNGFDIYSNQLVLEGTFNALTAVVYAFEKEFSQSKIVSISYEKIKHYNNKKDKLHVRILFQNYEKIN